jgi:signal transduction histidine kinase
MSTEATTLTDGTALVGDDTRTERAQTDESLRAERKKVDATLHEQLTAIDETADAVITLARKRADEVVAAARARTDRQSASSAAGGILERERDREDAAVQQERATADEALRQERAEHVQLLSLEREETDKDLLSERVRADDAVATRDDFLGIVSHDLKNMLGGVIGFAALIESGLSGEQVVVHARRIQRSAARMDRLIGDLVDVASIEAGTLAVTREPGDPAHVVTEAVETFQARAAEQRVSLTVENMALASVVAFDPARILQVLGNLLSNAIKFTPAGGTVVVRLEHVGDELRFAVSDTGIGIPADKLEAVFGRFVQVRRHDRRGVGLGLHISKCIVEGHGGRIWAENRTGGGTTLCFTLPIAAE